MAKLGIEHSLEKASEELSTPLFAKYTVLRERLLNIDYPHWSAHFVSGNDHGPSHIQRVLEKLDRLLGQNPIERQLITPYELFLTMMSVLYHDMGILRQRKGHAEISALLVEEEQNTYIVDEHDREIISAAVVSHSGEKHIETECERFLEVELIGGHTVRPRVIAALVRLADELDEDLRRGDSILEKRLRIPEESQFFWRFCQRIIGIEPRQRAHAVFISVKFDTRDVGSIVRVDGEVKSFLSAFAEKLTKINRERVIANRFLPEELRYHRMIVSVRPLEHHERWKRPREFVFSDHTSANEFVAAFPELLQEPATQWLLKSLKFIREDRLEDADAQLQKLEEIIKDLPAHICLAVSYDRACVESLRAEKLRPRSPERRKALDRSFQHLTKWITRGQKGAWQEAGKDPSNEIHRMGCDSDLRYILSRRKSLILDKISKEFRSALPKLLPRLRPSGGGGGCVPARTSIQTPKGPVFIEDIRVGDQILSLQPAVKREPIATRVAEVHTYREPKCIRLNRRHGFTPAQLIYEGQNGWTQAVDLRPGMWLLDLELKRHPINHLEKIDGYFEVYNLTTDHPSQNYVAYGLICHNKYYA